MICTEKKGTCQNLAVFSYLWPWDGNGNQGATCHECLPQLRSLEQQLARTLTLMPIIAPAESQRDIAHLQTKLATADGRLRDVSVLLESVSDREASALRELGRVRDELLHVQQSNAATVAQLEQEIATSKANESTVIASFDVLEQEVIVLRELAGMLEAGALEPNARDVLVTWRRDHLPTQQG